MRTLGFETHLGGRHEGAGTENALVRFGLDYIELLSVRDETEALGAGPNRRALVEMLRRGPGAAGFALAASGLEGIADRLARAGLTRTSPIAMRRIRPEGTELSWRVLHPTGVSWRRPWPFLIDWAAADAERLAVERPGDHANDAESVAGVSVLVDDLDRATAIYRALGLDLAPGRDRSDVGASAMTAVGTDVTISILVPTRPGEAAEALRAQGPGLFEIDLRSRDLDRTRDYMQRVAAPRSAGTMRIAVPPDDVLGARFGFVT